MIKKSSRKPVMASRSIQRKPVMASSVRATSGKAITASVAQNRKAVSPIMASLTPAQQSFVRTLEKNTRSFNGTSIMAATNTSNIFAKPAFTELLPLYVQKLIILDVFGSVAMNSRSQFIPYYKIIAENTKGETAKGDILNSPFVNKQGVDPNFSGRVVKNESLASNNMIAYTPVLPGSVTIVDGGNQYIDNGEGSIVATTAPTTAVATINYATGLITAGTYTPSSAVVTYQYDNETVGADENGQYGAKMGKLYANLDEINMIAEAHQFACYWSIYSAFVSQQEQGANLGEMLKEAAIGEITAEINSLGFDALAKAASYKPQFNWDATPVLQGSVVPSDYMNTFRLKLQQASNSVYQTTHLSQPNKLIVGSNVDAYLKMINGFSADSTTDVVGPYKSGTLDQFDVYVDPTFDPNYWVMACKGADYRRSSALFGEYMPIVTTDAIGLANASVQQGYATMFAMKVVNPQSIVSGKILGTF